MKKIADSVENATNGKPLQNAVVSLNTGTADSHSPVTIYSTNDVSGPSMTSVTTDEDGYYEFYAPNGSYLFKAQYGDTVRYVADFEVFDLSDMRAFIDALPTLSSGAYLPTLTNVSNLDASTTYPAQYLRVGDAVNVTGRVDVDPTTGSTFTDLGISLPIASNLFDNQLAGVGGSNAIPGSSAIVYPDTVNNRAVLSFYAPSTSSYAIYYSYTYRVVV